MTPVDIVKTIVSSDRLRRLHIYRHSNFFAYAEEVDAETVGGKGWMPVTSSSGVYDRIEVSEREAALQVPRLRNQS